MRSALHCQRLSRCTEARVWGSIRVGSAAAARPALALAAPGRGTSVARRLQFAAQAAPAGQPGAAGSTPLPPRAGKKKSKKNVDINGEVSKDLGNGMFNIKLENGVTVMAHLSGKIRQNRIKIVGGDNVTVELSPYDLTKGRITYRFRPGEYESLQNGQAAAQQEQQQQR